MEWQKGMEAAVAYIEAHLDGDCDLRAAARLAGCSVWEFQRMFSFLTHRTPGEYIRRRRLSLAAEELRRGDAKVIDVALRCGYESPTAFTRAFRQAYGLSPTAARRLETPPAPYPALTFTTGKEGITVEKRNALEAYSERGYYVEENAPLYFTPDMDRTCRWFRDALGWYGDTVAKNDAGAPLYGCVFDYPGELIVANLTPFRGIHLFPGEARRGAVVGFIKIRGLDRFCSLVRENGWEKISAVTEAHWGARECSVTTIDGCVLRFFETND